MRSRYRAEFFLFLCTIIWGGTFIATRFGLDSADALFLVAARFGIATVLFGIVLWRRTLKSQAPNRKAVYRGMLLGLVLFIAFYTQTLGLESTTVTRSAFITQLLVLITPLLQFVLFRHVPARKTILGAVVVLIGMFLLTTGPELLGGISSGNQNANSIMTLQFWSDLRSVLIQTDLQFNPGDWITLGCAFAFALYIVLIDRFSTPETSLTLTFFQSLFITIIALVIAVPVGGFRVHWDLNLYLSLAYLGPLGVNVVIYWHMRYQPESTPARAAVIFTMEPVFAAIFAFFIFQETLVAISLIGALLIIVGILISEWPSKRAI